MIDEKSLQILKILQEKARIPNVEVARQVNMAPSAVLERIRKLEKQGIIDGYEVILNPERINRALVAFVKVYLDNASYREAVGDALAEIEDIMEVHFITGDDCYLLKLRAADIVHLDEIIRTKISGIQRVSHTETSVSLATLKETARIPLDLTLFSETP